ncbi:MAG: hypothetical protein GY924_22535 [Planctomycetaceae bacterium]|nr:hypothetical protein [Planctomycetaceae bacterium]
MPKSISVSGNDAFVVEGGGEAVYTIVTNGFTNGSVEVTALADAQSELSVDGVNFASSVTVTFDETNGTTPQEITVRAIDDTVVEGAHTSTITHAITSSDDPVNFPTSLEIDDLVVTVLDNDGINFVANYQDGENEGFYDPALGQQRRDALEAALDVWEDVLVASYAGETVYVDAKMDPQASGILGGANPLSYWNVNGVNGAGAPLANHLVGEDLRGSEAEIEITLNSNFASWYYGTDAATPSSSWDFMTVVIHEVGHGLNFFSAIQTDGSTGWDPGVWGIYESYLELGDGTNLINMATDAERAAAIISDDVYWGGANATAANSDNRVRIYAPNPYEPGSSVSHVNQATYAGVAVMTPALLNGVAIHTPNAFELGMMKDMGWTLANSGGSSSRAGGQGGNSATAGSFNGDDAGHNMRVADSGQTDAMEAGFGDSGLRSIWDDESILHPISKDLNPASVLAAETEKALVGGFDQSEDSNDDFFELLGKIDSQRQSESSDLAGLEKDSLATLNQRDELAQRRARKS